MRIRLPNGEEHDFVQQENVIVVTYRPKEFNYMRHVEHVCTTCPNADDQQMLYIFDEIAVQWCLGQRHDELRRWHPSEDEYGAYEKIHGTRNPPLTEQEIAELSKELKDNGAIWKELEDE